jgi:hypothetical protein
MRIVKSHRVWCAALGAAAAMMTAPAGVALAATPEVQTEAATAITASGATLNGELNTGVGSEKLEYDFAYSAGNRCEGGTLAPEPAASAEGAHKKVTTTVSALEPNTEYTVCLNATNSEDQTASGVPVSFTTASVKPVIGGEHVETESVGAFDAALEAEVNPENRVTTYSFEYSTSKTLAGARTVGEASLARAFTSETVGPVDLERALKPSTTYYYRAVAANAAGASTGPIVSFTTAAVNRPSVSAESVAEVTPTTAVAQERVDPEYQETTCIGVQYVDQQTFEATGYAGAAEVPCTHRHSERTETATATFTDLDANTTYHYRILVENASGLTEGPDATFRAAPYPPEVETGETSAITTSSATIAGSVDPGSIGPNSDTQYFFEYGPTTGYGSRTPLVAGDAGEGENAVQETAALEGLSADTTYHYRIVATNDLSGTPQSSYGADETFSTLATPPIVASSEGISTAPLAAALGSPLAQPATPVLLATPAIAFPKEEKGSTGTSTKTSTNRQKLAKALKACRKDKGKAKRSQCEKAAKKIWGRPLGKEKGTKRK